MSAALRCLVWAACLPLFWPPGVCPCHGPVELLTGDHAPADESDCPECCGADQSRLAAQPAPLTVDLTPAAVQPPVVAVRAFVVPRPAPPPHPSPPLYLSHCRLAC